MSEYNRAQRSKIKKGSILNTIKVKKECEAKNNPIFCKCPVKHSKDSDNV